MFVDVVVNVAITGEFGFGDENDVDVSLVSDDGVLCVIVVVVWATRWGTGGDELKTIVELSVVVLSFLSAWLPNSSKYFWR